MIHNSKLGGEPDPGRQFVVPREYTRRRKFGAIKWIYTTSNSNRKFQTEAEAKRKIPDGTGNRSLAVQVLDQLLLTELHKTAVL